MKTNQTIAELKRIADENGGLLKPEVVVAEARPKTSPLHSRFCWDDSKAAHEFRLWQARQLIRVVVEVMPGIEGKHEVFVSLTSDRKEEGGYRVLSQVLNSSQMRAQMLNDALTELNLFQQKYARLKELASVFDSIRKVKTIRGEVSHGQSRRSMTARA